MYDSRWLDKLANDTAGEKVGMRLKSKRKWQVGLCYCDVDATLLAQSSERERDHSGLLSHMLQGSKRLRLLVSEARPVPVNKATILA